ncbi:protein of unknown function [Sterolibacterium denitrificans]|uniref:Uncharacterized protein n=1 Tax=Sterolibacterium denitrificans TaxID=157592 RepID=A0A7Z7MVN1_9PROT|nr:protein of unknown function [Sterolibacterium denitrificans]
MLLKLKASIETDLTDVHGFMQLQVKERQFTDSLVCNLRMQPQRSPYARAWCSKCRSTPPCAGCSRN